MTGVVQIQVNIGSRKYCHFSWKVSWLEKFFPNSLFPHSRGTFGAERKSGPGVNSLIVHVRFFRKTR